MSLRALMVDVDGVVVIRPDGRRWDADLEANLGVTPEALQRAFFDAHFKDVILGKADLHERLSMALAEIAPHLAAEQLLAYWFTKDAHLDHRLLADLEDVRATGMQLHLATLQEHRRADYLWTTLGLNQRFDAMHYAAALGCGKPDLAFYRAVEARTGFRPSEVLLIDDNAQCVKGARAAGWKAFLWKADEHRLADALASWDET